MLNTDTITLYKKNSDNTFSRFVVDGVQWTERDEVVNSNGQVNVAKHVSITFFEGTYEDLDLVNFTKEDAIFYGNVTDKVVDGKISTLLKKYRKSGVIKSVKDNSNRDYLKNIKVVLI